jgi:hypothetical protein
MAAGTTLNPGVGGDKIYDDDGGDGFKYPASKLMTGASGVPGTLVTTSNPMPMRQCDGTGFITPVIQSQLPASLGQKTMSASLAVAIASDQGAVPISAASLPALSGTTAVSIAATIGVSGTVTANQGTANTAANGWFARLTDATNNVAVKAASTAAVAADPALVVAISPNNTITTTTANSTTANAPAQQAVGTSSVAILATNATRKKFMIVNTGLTTLYLGFAQTPTISAYHVALASCANSANDGSGGAYGVDGGDIWGGAVNAISSAAGGTVCVTEFT